MTQSDPIFHICQFTPKGGNRIVYRIDSQRDADEFCELKNENLAAMGVPGSACCWFTTGPHQQTTGTN